jgi:hypothetical protein
METRILKEMIGVVKAEEQRRVAELDNVDPYYADDRWLFTDRPFVNELYLMVLVTLRHQVERELVKIAARVGGHEISGAEYQANVKRERELLRGGGWGKLEVRLKLKSFPNKYVETLRLLANSYKHVPAMEPEKELLNLLHLERDVKYAPLPESESLQEALGLFVGLGKDAAFYDIAEKFIDEASDYLDGVQRSVTLSPVKWGRASLNPKDFLH